MSLILKTDSYKLTQWPQYPPGTTKVYSYLESRGGLFPRTVFFGLQYIIKKYMLKAITYDDIMYADDFCRRHFGNGDIFNRAGWEYILNEHGGHLPLKIMAVPEGTVVPYKNVLMTIENTDDKCYWLTNYLETLLMKVWGSTTVATNSFYCKKIINESINRTKSPVEGLPFKLHDFGYRGVVAEEAAGILDAAHLTSFQGSDTIEGIELIREFYNWHFSDGFPAYSVVASEHSTATPYGRGEGEKEFLKHMLTTFPTGIVSIISDSFDVFGFIKMAGDDPDIKNMIMERDGTTVFRLDSGDPTEVILKCLDILWQGFGGYYTENHFRILNDKVRILQGDGIDREMIGTILNAMENNKFATDNIIFGSGGGLLQKFNRDTNQFAIKCSYAIINGKEVNVQKDPITGNGKKSKQGRLKLSPTGRTDFMTISSNTETPQMFGSYADALIPIFENGKLLVNQDFIDIRKRVDYALKYTE